MSWPSQKRISLDSVHVRPGGKIKVACWGMCPGLEFIATTDSDWSNDVATLNYKEENKNQYVLGTKLTDKQCKVTDLACALPNVVAKEFQFFEQSTTARIILKMGSAVWDWMRIHITKNVPEVIAKHAVTSGALNVEVLWSVPQGVGFNFLPHSMTVTQLILGKHGLKLNLNPGTSYDSTRYIGGFDDGVICSYNSWGNLDKLANKLKESPRYRKDALMVVMANAREESMQNADNHKKLTGVTVSQYKQVNPFVVLNVHTPAVDGATLLHEMGHAAGFCDHSQTASHFMSYGTMRNEVTGGHIDDFRKSFFWSSN
jgi:hypothetical protein